jgi:hypothetical protein
MPGVHESIKATGNRPPRFFAEAGCPRALFQALDKTEMLRNEKNEETKHNILFDDSLYVYQAFLAGSF